MVYYLVYGGGKFGFNAIEKLKSKNKLIVLVDQDPECFISQKYELTPVSIEFVEKFLQNIKKDEKEDSNHLDNILFLVGDIATIAELLRTDPPDIFIPSAPIHVMKDLGIYYLHTHFPSFLIQSVEPTINLLNKPDEMHYFSFNDSEKYLSYAGWNEICPDHCTAPESYCPFHKKKKPITVYKFLKNNVLDDFHLCFNSEQLGAGLGGILGSEIQSFFLKLTQHVNKRIKNSPINVYISTSCNCHGVISKIEIKIS
ncbi:hypothetical protein NEF87_005037 [Candidatus Lokiarchaeum ossiferum]|uniref:Uncharacterized protein n=1 Tax=Candidatus Lokiarchaeum ossiferum TaxID=2951803 RepID=A0ABY6HZ07_9ARCH|nr:hypothetical protein NEF87_005037 [Candidatus Lokiarchaeum sp. B-35]